MKVIFLDHDGVICLAGQWGGRHKKTQRWKLKNPDADAPAHVRLDNFDGKAVKILNEILEVTGAEIVVSSDWKLHATLEELQEMYKLYGVIKSPIAVTKRLEDFDSDFSMLCKWKGWLERGRMSEIAEYVRSHPEIEKWVAVDDLHMYDLNHEIFEEIRKNFPAFVYTPRSTEGIKQSGIKQQIIEALNGIEEGD